MLVVIENVSILIGEDLDYVESGYIEIENGLIKSAGEGRWQPGNEAKEEEEKNKKEKNERNRKFDAGGFLVVPGFINAHTHIADSIGKDIAVGGRLDAQVHPVFGAKKKILQKSPPEQLAAMIRSSAYSMLQKGITTFADFREGGPDGVRLLKGALDGMPIKCIALGRVDYYFSDPSKAEGLPKDALSAAEDVLKIADGLGISGANENTDTALEQYSEVAAKCRMAVTERTTTTSSSAASLPPPPNTDRRLVAIHAAESAETAQFSKSHTGKSEVERIIRHLKPDILVHMTHASADEISLLVSDIAKAASSTTKTTTKATRSNSGGGGVKQAAIVVCPRANGVLGAGLPPVAEMLRKRSIIVAIGTDNVMLNSPDMFREMDYLWKASHAQGEFIEPREIVKMATVNAAKMFGTNSGWIEAGRAADLVFIDKGHVDIYPMHDPYASIVHRASKDAIRSVMVGGKFVV
jgi:cytosine/adenosine deaminase-related metal-dependent hydrolase